MIDEKSTKETNEVVQTAKELNAKVTIYTSKDSFQDVAWFYKSIAKEYMIPRSSGTTGKPKKSDLFERDLWEAFFIFDSSKTCQALSSQLRCRGNILERKSKMQKSLF